MVLSLGIAMLTNEVAPPPELMVPLTSR
jgi:hypothetical protein